MGYGFMKIGLLVLLISLLGLFLGCANDSDSGGWQTISAEQARVMMSELEEFVLLDVRTLSEFETRHIGGATLMPHDQIGYSFVDKFPDKDMTILVYCQSGRRSGVAAAILAELGYLNIYDFGGIIDWVFD